MASSKTPKNGEKSLKQKKTKKDFLTVGIGASAGGIKALKEFFSKMPTDSGMAFVVVLHLSQTHESNLHKVLQRETTMPVIQVRESVKIEPNHVYVIPPAQQLEMVDGVVRLVKPERIRGQRVAIDRFFRTLADSFRGSAVGIILSGAGEDGTLGIKKIKEVNGFTIAQKPDEAEHEQMPRSAISTGMVDCVLPVEQMPQKLLSLRESTDDLNLTDGDDGNLAPELRDANAFRDVLAILRVRTGHDFSHYKQPTMLRRIARHLQIHDLEDLQSYAKFLRENPDEADFLLKNLLINVTTFFRDKESFEVLEEEIIPRLFAGKSSEDDVRVWVAGCASGEEAYSIGMLFSEYASRFEDVPKIQIFASDVDDEAIAQAREAIYPEGIVDQVTPDRLKRFFIKEGRNYRIKKELREMILFAPHNILRDPPFSKLDLVTCRNVMIYLNRDTQERLMHLFHFALRPNGILFVGSSETAEQVPLLFTPYNKKHRIYMRRPTNPIAHPPLAMPVRDIGKIRTEQVSPKTGVQSIPFSELHFNMLEKFAPPSVLVNEDYEIVHLSQNAGRFLKFVGGEPTNNLLKLINPDLRADLRAGLFTAKQERRTAEIRRLRARIDGENSFINLKIHPVDPHDAEGGFLLIIFEEAATSETEVAIETMPRSNGGNGAMDMLAHHFEEELQRTKERLRVTVEQYDTSIEELKAANEELQAINEELRSATEELETSKEELQSVNEELTTVNNELKEKIDEVSHVNSDLQNLMRSTNIGVIFLDRNLRIKRFTPALNEIFNVIQTDIGRPFEHLTHNLEYRELATDAKQVLRSLQPTEREIRSLDGKYYLTRLLPYRTIDERIDGIVITFLDITELKQTEISKFFLASIVESSQDSIISIDFDRNITSWNKGAEYLYGYKAAEAIGKNLSMLSLPEDLNLVIANVDKVKHSHEVVIFDSVRIHKSGREMNLEVALSPVKNDAGEVIGVSTIARDVTERRKAEEALRESEKNYHTLFDSIDEGFCTIDVLFDENEKPIDYRFMQVNPAFERHTGIENAVGKTMREIAPGHEEYWFEIYGRVAQTGESVRFENEAAQLGRWYDVYAFPVEDPNHRRVGILFNDITERKRVEETLRESEERFRALVSQATAGICRSDLDGKLVFVNQRYCEMLGYTESEIIGKTFWEITYDGDSSNFEENKRLFERLQTKGEPFQIEKRLIRKDGKPIWANVSVAAMLDASGKPQSTAAVVVDISERKLAEAKLRHSQEMFSALVSNAPFGVYLIDSEFRLRSVNHGAQAVFSGIDPLIGRDFAEILRIVWEEPFATEAIERFRHTLETGESYYSPTIVEHRGNIDKIESYDWQLHRITLPDETYGVVCYFYDLTEQRQMQHALRESEERFRSIVTQVTAGIAEVDLTGRFNFVNDRYVEIVGYSREELLGGMRMQDITHPDDLKINYPLFEKCITEGKPFVIEKRYLRKDGTEIWVNNSVSPELDEEGKTRFVTTVTLDITERRKTEEALRESEERFRAMFEQASVGIVQVTLDGQLIMPNPGFCKIIDYNEDEVRNLNLRDICHPEDYVKEVELIRQLFAGEIPGFIIEKRYIRKDGSIMWGQMTTTLIRRGTEEPLYALAIVEDISERKQTAEALQQSEERLRQLVESINDYAIFTLTPDNRISSWNPGAERIFGYTEEEILGESGEILFTPEDRKLNEPEKEMKTAIETGRAADERWHLRKDDSRFYASGVLNVLGDNPENGFVKILRDLTERKQFEEALREADRRKDEFLATLAHELRNPLAPIRSGLEVIRRADCDDATMENTLGILERQTDQIVHLVDDLLEISRITQGKIKLRKARIELKTAVDMALESSQGFIETAGHQITIDLPEKPIYLDADLMRITQVLLNLLNNCVKYTEPGGKIWLTARKEDSEVVISIKDTGIGIPAEMLPKIFDLFSQVNTTSEQARGGLGIGLSVVKKLIEMHGGSVQAFSEGEMKGSEFIVRLPLAEEQTEKQETQKASETEIAQSAILKTSQTHHADLSKSHKILVVDDNADATQMLEILLSMEGHEIRTAFDAESGIEVAREFQPDVCLLDIGLPDMNGYEAAKNLRQFLPDALLISISGWGQEEDRRLSREAGFNYHLVKPVEIEDINKLLDGDSQNHLR